jgi:hypothetical protein
LHRRVRGAGRRERRIIILRLVSGIQRLF